MRTPSVAIVILNWNGKLFLEKFLPSVLSSTYSNKQIIVADNASTDDSISFLKQHYPEVGILINPVNEGFAKGYNTALKQVSADYYVLLNSDVEVTSNWIEPIINLMEADQLIAACQPKLLDYYHRDYFEYAGASGGWIDSFGYPFTRGRIFDTCEKDYDQYDTAIPCFWATGAAMFVRASIYHEMKGLDSYFFAHQEEIDLCWRMQLQGYKVYVQPASVVYHVGGGTLPKGNNKKVYLNYRNNLIMMAKNLPFLSACWKLPFRFGLDAFSAYRAFFNGDRGHFIAVAKAHFSFFYWLFFVKNETFRGSKKRRLVAGVYAGMVVWDYFIKKKRTFKQILSFK